MPKTLILDHEARCADPRCRAKLHPGDRVVIYGRAVYGRDCHAKRAVPEAQSKRIAAYAAERLHEGGNP